MARRGRGEGGITKRRDGRWMGQADLGWQDGKRRRKSLYGRTKSEVQAKLRETLHRKAHGMPPVPEQETVGTFLRRWLDVKKEGVRQRTWTRYEQIVRAHLLPNLDRIRLASSRRRTWPNVFVASRCPAAPTWLVGPGTSCARL